MAATPNPGSIASLELQLNNLKGGHCAIPAHSQLRIAIVELAFEILRRLLLQERLCSGLRAHRDRVGDPRPLTGLNRSAPGIVCQGATTIVAGQSA